MNSSLLTFRRTQSKVGTARCAVRSMRTSQRDIPTAKIQRFILRTPNSELRTAFTLIELLVVIAIIGLLAGLIAGLSGIAAAHKAKSRVTTERDALVTAIERYKKAKGFYPPDNPTDPTCIQTPLFYELTGTKMYPSNSPPSFESLVTGEFLTTNQLGTLFGISGFINSSADPTSPAENFYTGIRNQQHLLVTNIFNSGNYYFQVMGVPVSGPQDLNPAPGTAGGVNYINPWRYNMSHPTNNHDTFDLWMDVKYGGKTNRISNWSDEPKPL